MHNIILCSIIQGHLICHKCIFINVFADINDNTCVIFEKTLQQCQFMREQMRFFYLECIGAALTEEIQW